MHLSVRYVQGSGNYFVLVDEALVQPAIQEAQRASLSRLLCRTQKEQGKPCDGVLFFAVLGDEATEDCAMRMFNPDGSEAEMCGNGLRCAARYGVEVLRKKDLSIQTPQAVLHTSVCPEWFDGIAGYQTEIGPIGFALRHNASPPSVPATLQDQRIPLLEPLLGDLSYTALTIPNPHLVGISKHAVSSASLLEAWESVQQAQVFPEGINLSVVVSLAPQKMNALYVMTCERGVGLTNACGTAMSASTVVAHQAGLVDAFDTVRVFNPGGFVDCRIIQTEQQAQNSLINAQNSTPAIEGVFLTGNATWIENSTVHIEVPLPDHSSQVSEQITWKNTQSYAKETSLYKAIADYAKDTLESHTL